MRHCAFFVEAVGTGSRTDNFSLSKWHQKIIYYDQVSFDYSDGYGGGGGNFRFPHFLLLRMYK